jgi:hypothetical protein
MRRLLPTLLLLASALPAAAANPPASASADDLAFFEKKVRPVLVRRCQECHSTRAKKKRGGLLLDSRAAVLAGGDSGPVVVAGEPGKSLLVQAVRYEHASLAMPPKGKLPAGEVAVLEEWVRRGAPFPGPSAALARGSIDLAAGRTFWSFGPLKVHAPAVERDSTWARRRIDAFLLAAMQKQGLSPAAPAGRRALIRRVTFDLVGLPPTPEEIEAFVEDGRPDAYSRLVERLLASPAHGERWGRFWLDLVRYCDVGEPWAESKGSAWLYRDWVVRAVNDDLPYDRFVQKQLAADLMPDTPPADRAALGFLGLGPNYWKELKLDHNVIKGVVAEEWEERIHTTCSTFLGLTVACARCHDHKFDPISTQDYYALAGVFASIRQADLSLLPGELARRSQKAREELRGIEMKLNKLRKGKKLDEAGKQQVAKLVAEAQRLRSVPHVNEPLAPGVIESSLHVEADGPDRTRLTYRPQPQDVAVQVRGNAASSGPVVPRRFLAVLSGDDPRPFRQGSGRLELAQAILRDAGPLAARVIVNRVWEHHFGAGLVRTPSDFGKQGERPTHPELLDDLAARFVRAGWSLKWLHREIVLSAAYQQSSKTSDRAKVGRDPDNRWLARMNRRRLEVEAWRDAILAVVGSLDLRQGGPSIEIGREDNQRRTLYGNIKRRELNDLLRLNDFPDPTTHSAARLPTTTPLQQLFVLNSAFMARQSAALARRLQAEATDDQGRIGRAYRLLYGRAETAAEERLGLAFLAEAGGDRQAGWVQYAQVLLGSNEFLWVD